MFKFWKSVTGKKDSASLQDSSYAFLGTDIHSHVLPGIDDGAKTLEDSLALIQRLKASGYTQLIATPHINEDIYRNTPALINEKLSLLRDYLEQQEIEIQIHAAAEYMIDGSFMKLLDSSEPLLVLYENKVLVEMSYMHESPNLYDAIFRLQARGYIPVLAHPERYVYYHGTASGAFKDIKERGCLFQLNTIALTGYYGKEVKKMAEQLLDQRMYDLCGTDVHHLRHISALESLLGDKIILRLEEYGFLNGMIEQPGIITGFQ